ncbi:MAG TPA: site-2 protease family protein [Acidimicrobiia bacterium]|nr:site-2 protease family protein [Acidimicrobiia bacterium]
MLRFPLFGVPVSIHFSFLLVALFGLPIYRGWEIAAWTGAVFIAVLLHESGHAFTARAFGASPVAITLFALGGFTSWSASKDLGPGRRFVVSAAGSAVGIAAGLAVIGLGKMGLFRDLPDLAFVFLESFVWAGLVWGILNWIPILPLDGGHMLQHALEVATPTRAPAIARVVSVIAGVIVVAVAWWYEQRFLAIFVAMITFMGFREGRDERPKPEPPPTRPRDEEPPAFPI